MQMSQLRPANQLAKRFGVKAILYGAPGSGKTPILNTAPRPVLLVTEPGMLSMRNSNIPCWEAFTLPLIEEFKKWFAGSREASNFDTLQIDSISQLAEIKLRDAQAKNSHGMKAYGVMADYVFDYCNELFYMPNKHIILVAKQMQVENGKQTIIANNQITYEPVLQKKPYFPGKDLNVRIPHMFDSVWHLGEAIISGYAKPQKAIRTIEIPEIFARDRSGNLSELEPPNLTDIFNKAMQ